jgi:hypothetical protein
MHPSVRTYVSDLCCSIHRDYREALLESTHKIKAATAESYELLPETIAKESVAVSKASPVAQVQG